MTLEELWRIFPIILKEYNPDYPHWYDIEKSTLLSSDIKSHIRRISHFGSTAVPGLIAKPTVDILLEVSRKTDFARIKRTFENLNYLLMREETFPEPKLVWNKGYTPEGFADKVYHLHVRCYADWDELYFRDYLIAHPDIAEEYGNLKKKLFALYEFDRDAYTNAKTDFIGKYTRAARKEFKGKYEVK